MAVSNLNQENRNFRRGEVYYVDFSSSQGSEQGGIRPALILQNNIGNYFCPTITVVPLSSKVKREDLSTHYILRKDKNSFLVQDSIVCVEQVRAVDKKRFKNYFGTINKSDLRTITGLLFANLCGE